MLSRTADHLFWMSRYTERAENTARMLDVNYQTSLLPQSAAVAELGWKGLLSIRRGQPFFHHFMPACGARERACCPRRPDHRGLGNPKPDLAGVEPPHTLRGLRA